MSEPEPEVLDGEIVSASDGPRAVGPARPGGQVVAQAAAVAGAGLMAGAATVAMVRTRKVRKVARRRRKQRAKLGGSVVASHSFLVDVHLLSRD
jgi:hypothetical protein